MLDPVRTCSLPRSWVVKPARWVGVGAVGDGLAEGEGDSVSPGAGVPVWAGLGDGLGVGVGLEGEAVGDAVGDAVICGTGVGGRSVGPGWSNSPHVYAWAPAPRRKRNAMMPTPSSANPPRSRPRYRSNVLRS